MLAIWTLPQPKRPQTEKADLSVRLHVKIAGELEARLLLGFLFFLARFVGGVEGMLERNQIFTRFEGVQCGLFGFQLLVRVIGRLDAETDSPIAFVDLNHASGHFLADFEHVFDLVHALFTDL